VGYDGGADHVVSYAGITPGNVGALIDGAIFTRGTSEKKEHDRSCMLKERLRQALIDQAQTGKPTTYNELADRLGLEPPQTIHRLGEALETLMKEDVVAIDSFSLHGRGLEANASAGVPAFRSRRRDP